MNKEHTLHVTFGTSRGRDTYGYTLVTLRENGKVKARCNGGGYDMRGTVFADWLYAEYQAQLLELAKISDRFPRYVWNAVKGEGSSYVYPDRDKRESLYGGHFYINGSSDNRVPHVTLDGGCGFSSMVRIAEAIGLTVRQIDAGKHADIILVSEKPRVLVEVSGGIAEVTEGEDIANVEILDHDNLDEVES